MTTYTMTIYDPDGVAYEMEWSDALDFDMVNWCALCEATITAGWWREWPEGYGVFIVCVDCAQSNRSTEGR